jgi:Ser/Thr protein kinase RdoA (MazF antagonist)
MRETSAGSSQTLGSTVSAGGRAPYLSSATHYQPIIYSTLSMEGIKRLVVQHYDFDESVECTFFCRGVSDTYLLSSPAGRFAFKVHRTNWRAREAILWEMAALIHMGGKGVEVAMPVPRRDGEFITELRAPEGLRSAVLFHWANGHAPEYTDSAHALQYGRLVAKLHTAGDDLPPNGSRPKMDMEYLFAKPLARIRSRLRDLPSVAARLTALEERTLIQVRRAEKELGDWGFCHGDVWANNARIDGNRLVLFDFDFCGSGWQVFDLASYRWHARYVDLEQASWKPFIEGYLQIRPAAASSLEFIGLFMILKHLWTTAHWIGRLPETGAYFLSDQSLENLVPFCEKIESEGV